MRSCERSRLPVSPRAIPSCSTTVSPRETAASAGRLADFLSQGYDDQVQPQQLITTAGASQALDLICTFFTRPGDTVFVEEPSYFLALRILQEDHRLHAVPIATDEDGLVPAAVEEALTRHRPVFLYTIPTYQNPTGRTLSRGRRQELLALAEAHDFLIVADEVYHLLHFGTPPPPPFAAQVDSGRVLSIGSFSKILAPGLRLGWMQTTPERAQRFAPERTGGQRRRTQPVHLESGARGAGERRAERVSGQPAPRIPGAGRSAGRGAAPRDRRARGVARARRRLLLLAHLRGAGRHERAAGESGPAPRSGSCPAGAAPASAARAAACGSALPTMGSRRSKRGSGGWDRYLICSG